MRRSAALAALPLLLVALLIAGFLIWRPFDFLTAGLPPAEEVVIERVVLDENGIHAYVRAQGSAPLTIAQVQVDSAYRVFTMTPPGPLSRFATARVDISFPWVMGEAHSLVFLTNTGAAFEHAIDVAAPTPKASASSLATLALVGFMVGVVPVAIGLAFHPAMRRRRRGRVAFPSRPDRRAPGVPAVRYRGRGSRGRRRRHRWTRCARRCFWSAAVLSLIVLLGDRSPRGPLARRHGARLFHRRRHRSSQSGRGPRHRCFARYRQGGARFLLGPGLRDS